MTSPEGDTRWTAILSIDMAGFTALSQRLGNEQVFDLLHRALGIASEVITAYGGHVVDTAGDGILATFGAPKALENASLQCCRAAVAFQNRIELESKEFTSQFGECPNFRIGIAGGPVMVAWQETDGIKVVGTPVNLAARIQEIATLDEIALTDAVRREVEGLIRTTEMGSFDVKGFDDRVLLYRLDGLAETNARFEGALRRGVVGFVSREEEMKKALAVLSGSNPLLVLTGAAGIGKSRLAHEVTSQISGGRHVFIGQCAATREAAPFGPVLDMLRQASGSPDAATRRDILTALCVRYPDICTSKAVDAFAAPIIDDSDHKGRALRDREILLELLHKLSVREKCLYVLEDAHWIDSATNSLLSAFSESPKPMIITARPEFTPDWLQGVEQSHIELGPLSSQNIHRISEAVIGQKISTSVTDLVAQKSEGLPLIAEEMARALEFGDHLVPGDQGLELAESNIAPLTGNLEHMVLSRVDLLPPSQRTVLQIAATIGREFPENLLNAITGGHSELETINEQSPGLIEPQSEGQWRFSHGLFRDAIYGSLLTAKRQKIHRQVAESIEASGSDAPEILNLLAIHFAEADIPARAVPYLVKVAAQSLKDYALSHVDRILEQAMTYLEKEPGLVGADGFQDLAITWLRALEQIGDFGRLQAVSDRVLPRLARSGYTPAFSIARTLTAIAKTHLRDYSGAEKLALETLNEAEKQSDDWGAAWARVALMRTYDETGWQSPDVIEELALKIAPVAKSRGDDHLAMTARYLLSSAYRSSGRRLKALEISEEILKFSETHDDRRALSYAHWARALIYTVEGNPEMALVISQKALNDAIPGSADDKVSRAIMAFAQTFLQKADKVRPSVLALNKEALSCGDYNLAHSMQWTLAALELRAGHLALGWRLLNRFIPEAIEAGNQNLVRQAYLLRSEFLLALLGLIDPQSEAPPDRPKPQRARPGLVDIVTFLRLRLTAKRIAHADFMKIIELDPQKRGVAFARAQVGLGLIAASGGKKDAAFEHLNTGLRNAEQEGLTILVQRANEALSRLDKAH